MQNSLRALAFVCCLSAIAAILILPAAARPPKSYVPSKKHRLWVTAYYPIWQQQSGTLTPGQIDYTAFSHLIHFSVLPAPDGTVDPAATEYITPAQSRAVLAPAHAAGRKVLLCVGGANSAPRFRPALSDAARPAFVRNLVRFAVTRGYDGLDIDMEPIEDGDDAAYARFIRELRARLRAASPKLLLTAATASQPALFARLQTEFDQINLMTYDLSGPWPGWETWYNAALTDGGQTFPGSGRPLPSVQGTVRQFTAAGVHPDKMGIGLAFYGSVWSGATAPQQGLTGVTCAGADYAVIMDTYYRPDRYHWDGRAQAPYLSIDAPQPPQRKFISYDDEVLCAKKVRYAREAGLGGVIIWELSGGYRASQPPGKRDQLLQSVKHAWLASAEAVLRLRSVAAAPGLRRAALGDDGALEKAIRQCHRTLLRRAARGGRPRRTTWRRPAGTGGAAWP